MLILRTLILWPILILRVHLPNIMTESLKSLPEIVHFWENLKWKRFPSPKDFKNYLLNIFGPRRTRKNRSQVLILMLTFLISRLSTHTPSDFLSLSFKSFGKSKISNFGIFDLPKDLNEEGKIFQKIFFSKTKFDHKKLFFFDQIFFKGKFGS